MAMTDYFRSSSGARYLCRYETAKPKWWILAAYYNGDVPVLTLKPDITMAKTSLWTVYGRAISAVSEPSTAKNTIFCHHPASTPETPLMNGRMYDTYLDVANGIHYNGRLFLTEEAMPDPCDSHCPLCRYFADRKIHSMRCWQLLYIRCRFSGRETSYLHKKKLQTLFFAILRLLCIFRQTISSALSILIQSD